MAPTTSASSLPSRRLSAHTVAVTAPMGDHDHALSQSLSQLSLLSSADPKNGPRRLPEALQHPSSSRRTSVSPGHRMPSRSPSGRDSRPTTPTLLRKASMNSLHSGNGHGPGRAPSRRSSMTQAMGMGSPKATRSPSVGSLRTEEHRPPLTAAAVAAEYFRSEMQIHHGPDATLPSETVVILHDAVYGHRFSRPRTSRSALSTIVERPERVKAAVLGVSLAYVRLGDRHDEGAHPVHPRAKIHEIPKIPFRIRKSIRSVPLTSAAVTNVHGLKWMEELKAMCDTAESKLALGGRELQRPDNTDRDEPAQPLHEGDLYLCAESRDAMEGALGAVCDGVDAIFSPAPAAPRRAFVAVRPPGHHCAAAHPSGFCWVNNVLVGIMHGALTHGLTHAAIIDFDLHHGDGSQAIVWQHNARANAATKNSAPWKKTSIGYFSLHDINSYPCEMGDEDKVKNASLCIDNAHGQSVWNVHLQSWKTEREFWAIYESKYSVILERTRAYLGEQARRLRAEGKEPRAAIFFSAGFDASEWESAGMQRHQVNVPTEFYARLSQDVVRIANEQGLHVGGRVVSVLEGGYSDRALFSGVFSHLSGLVGDQSTAQQTSDAARGLSYEMGQKLGTITEPGPDGPVDEQEPAGPSLHQYDPGWWSSQHLDSLESLLANPSSPPRKPRTGTPPTYFSPTQASSAKVLDPVKVRRSLSGLSSTIQRPRAASPVAPDVPWTVAAHELSKVLIPSDRQVDSCRAEDLNAEATRVRRDKQSILLGIPIPPPTPAPQESRPTSRMALRERKARTAGDEAARASPSKRSASRGARAKSTEAEQAATAAAARGHQRRRSRRLSESTTSQSPGKEEPAVPVPPLPAEYEQHSRPPTAGSSSRAGSSMSGPVAQDVAVRNPQPPPPAPSGLNVKKTRQRGAGVAPKEPTPKTPRAAARARAAMPSNRAKTMTAKPIQSSQPPATVPATEPPVPPVDMITTGMRKIKINLITQSKRAANTVNKDATAAKSSAPVPPPPPPPPPHIHEPAPTLTTTPAVVEACPPLVPASDTDFLSRGTGSGLSTPLDEQSSIIDSPSPLEKRAPAAPAPAVNGEGEPRTAEDLFISYQPEGPTPVALKREDSLRWLEPNVAATPSPVKKKQSGGGGGGGGSASQLFQYTAAGIPFAPRPGSGAGEESKMRGEKTKEEEEEENKAKAMWEVPETPHRL